ncbi:MAG: rhodanese-like domain-containing protein [Ignavibacterium album]|uniref:rhodanese-like domain-containing protein n=1 Tax=Ignavibacterium album TaxID=591197 RepID=UPI0026EE40A0|nr:rhodanese-like domain-containing protein [Ignavibacterium album]MCX8105778.1 rhodanese-like domain-containing protein [Ignavibacterium album]
MDASQIFFYALLILIVIYIVRKVLLYRSVRHYSPVELAEKLKKDKNAVLLDVRTPMERKQDYIKGSFHIPLYDITSEQKELLKFKDKEIICYCRTGNRSLIAASKLRKLGYNSANLKGGIIFWKKAGLK